MLSPTIMVQRKMTHWLVGYQRLGGTQSPIDHDFWGSKSTEVGTLYSKQFVEISFDDQRKSMDFHMQPGDTNNCKSTCQHP